MADLSFGDMGWVTLLDGTSSFRQVSGIAGDPSTTVFLRGDVTAPELRQAVAGLDFSRVFGRAAALVHDRRQGRLSIFSDRYGGVPLFRVGPASDGRLAFATDLRTLLARGVAPRRIDRTGLAEVLAFDAPLGQRTLIDGVTAFPGGTRLDIDLDRRQIRAVRQWDPGMRLRRGGHALAETRGALFDAFMDGFDRCASDRPVGITLSGGVDSRCLLAAARCRGVPAVAFNCSVPGSRSARYAARMAAGTGTPYRAFPVDAVFARDYVRHLRGVLSLTEGMTFSSEAECHWLRQCVSGVTVVLHGAFAELAKLASMHRYFVDAATAAAPRAALGEILWKRLGPQVERRVAMLAPEVRAELRERAHGSLIARVESVDPGLTNDEGLQVLYIDEFLGKVTKCSGVIWNDRVHTRFPFAFPAFVDLLLDTRAADRSGLDFQRYLLARTCRPLSRVPDANTGLPVGAPGLARRLGETFDEARRVLGTGPASLDHSDLRGWLTASQPSPEAVLLDGTTSALFDRDAIREGLRTLRNPVAPGGWNPMARIRRCRAQHRAAIAIGKALTLRLWMTEIGMEAT